MSMSDLKKPSLREDFKKINQKFKDDMKSLCVRIVVVEKILV